MNYKLFEDLSLKDVFYFLGSLRLPGSNVLNGHQL